MGAQDDIRKQRQIIEEAQRQIMFLEMLEEDRKFDERRKLNPRCDDCGKTPGELYKEVRYRNGIKTVVGVCATCSTPSC